MTYMCVTFPSLRRWVSNRVSITVILAGFLAVSQAHADASITGKAYVIDGDSLASGQITMRRVNGLANAGPSAGRAAA
jgi:hypothetical protein